MGWVTIVRLRMHAVVADIHANLEALSAVLDHIAGQKIDRVLCLGDLIGFGPDPVACVDHAMGFAVTTRGCHDHRIFEDWDQFNPHVRQSCALTLEQLREDRYGSERLEFIRGLPMSHVEAGVLYAHCFPVEEDWAFLNWVEVDPGVEDAPAINEERWRQQGERVRGAPGPVLVGHTHAPGAYDETGRFRAARDLDHQVRLAPGSPLLVDVGAVGWPRDGDPRACYAVVDGDVLTWHRVEYDHSITTAKWRGHPAPPPSAEFRLAAGF